MQAKELVQIAQEQDLQDLYASVPQVLNGYGSQPGHAACALLQVRAHLCASSACQFMDAIMRSITSICA